MDDATRIEGTYTANMHLPASSAVSASLPAFLALMQRYIIRGTAQGRAARINQFPTRGFQCST